VVALNRDLPDLAVPAGAWAPGAALDGRAFDLAARVAGTGKTLPPDTFTFAGGRFQSARCQAYCDIGWQEYRTRQVDGVTHFTATTQCPDAPHTFVWHGTVDGDMLRVEGSWTTRRWYWTQQIRFAGEGRPAAGPAGG
jgi:hypothetical protein